MIAYTSAQLETTHLVCNGSHDSALRSSYIRQVAYCHEEVRPRLHVINLLSPERERESWLALREWFHMTPEPRCNKTATLSRVDFRLCDNEMLDRFLSRRRTTGLRSSGSKCLAKSQIHNFYERYVIYVLRVHAVERRFLARGRLAPHATLAHPDAPRRHRCCREMHGSTQTVKVRIVGRAVCILADQHKYTSETNETSQ